MAWRGKRASALYEHDDSGEGINAQVNKLRGTVNDPFTDVRTTKWQWGKQLFAWDLSYR